MSDSQFGNENGSVSQVASESLNQPQTKQEQQAQYEKTMAEYEERRLQRETEEAAKPWIEQQHWRRSITYKNWTQEQILERVGEFAAVTQSPYGYEVLTARDLGFIDIDFHSNFYEPWLGGWTWQPVDVLAKLKAWVAVNPGESYRVYRTAHGMRVMRTDQPQPLDQNYKRLSELLGGDPVYLRVCADEQRSFRARLSGKPLRVGITWPHWDFYGSGWNNDSADGYSFPPPIEEYKAAAAKYATCKLVETVGCGILDDTLAPLISFHDERCAVFSELPLEPLHASELKGPTWLQLVEIHEACCYDGMDLGGNHIWHADSVWDLMGKHNEDAQQAMRVLSPEKCREIRADDARATALKTEWLNEQRERSVLKEKLETLDQHRIRCWTDVLAEERRAKEQARRAALSAVECQHEDDDLFYRLLTLAENTRS